MCTLKDIFYVQAADLKVAINEKVVSHVNHLVGEGVCNVGEVKRHIRLFVQDLFRGKQQPSATNRRFFPSRADVAKLVFRQRKRLAQGLLDEQLLAVKAEEWRRGNTLIVLRHANEGAKFLMLYQAEWQKRLLLRYGNDMVLLDATYKTTQYALPLFFMCVKTNVGYCVVGAFVVQHEDTFSVSEALQVFRDANPDWRPAAFMVDASEVEMNAIASVFPGTGLFTKDSNYMLHAHVFCHLIVHCTRVEHINCLTMMQTLMF